MMLDFQRYQIAFTAHIRNPSVNKKPAKVPVSRMAIYREIVFNNIFDSVSACFPVCKSILGTRAWRKLLRVFFANHQANSPIFREIPQQFLQFLKTVEDLPDFFKQLAHYEWVELAVSAQQAEVIKLRSKSDLLNGKPVLAPASMLLEYDCAVHKISKRNLPTNTEKTYLLVFRNAECLVKFIELNAMTFQLLNLIKENKLTGKQILTRLAKEIKHPDIDVFTQFGAEILTDLAKQQAIIGTN
jgi:uncharacterized protein